MTTDESLPTLWAPCGPPTFSRFGPSHPWLPPTTLGSVKPFPATGAANVGHRAGRCRRDSRRFVSVVRAPGQAHHPLGKRLPRWNNGHAAWPYVFPGFFAVGQRLAPLREARTLSEPCRILPLLGRFRRPMACLAKGVPWRCGGSLERVPL